MSLTKSLKLIQENTQNEEKCLNIQSVLLFEKISSIRETQKELDELRSKFQKQFDNIEQNLNTTFNECMILWNEVADKKSEMRQKYREKYMKKLNKLNRKCEPK